MCMLDTIRAKRDDIYAVARRHGAEKLWVFGSCARKTETPESDVDFLVKFGAPIGLFEYSDLQFELEQIVGRKVDVVRNTMLFKEPRFAAKVCPEAVQL